MPPVDLLATPEDLRRWLQLEPDDTDRLPDATAELALGGPSRAVLNYTNRAATGFLIAEFTVRLDGSGSHEILLPGAPVTDVISVTQDPDGKDGDPIDVTDAVDWSADGILTVPGYWPLRRRYIEVVFRAGFDAQIVPEDVRNIVLRVAARAISNPEGLVQEGVEGYNAAFAFDETRIPTLTAPDRRELDPYRL